MVGAEGHTESRSLATGGRFQKVSLHNFFDGDNSGIRIEKNVAGEEGTAADVELSLGLSLNGRFGSDPEKAREVERSNRVVTGDNRPDVRTTEAKRKRPDAAAMEMEPHRDATTAEATKKQRRFPSHIDPTNCTAADALREVINSLKHVGAFAQILATQAALSSGPLEQANARAIALKNDYEAAMAAMNRLKDEIVTEKLAREASEAALGEKEAVLQEKEASFPMECRKWAKENMEAVIRDATQTREGVNVVIRQINKTRLGREAMVQVGTYGYMCGRKAERDDLYSILKQDNLGFQPSDYCLPEPHNEDLSEPFVETP